MYFQVDLQTFLTLTDADLKELGITTFGPRRKMLLAIQGKTPIKLKFQIQNFSTNYFQKQMSMLLKQFPILKESIRYLIMNHKVNI